MNILSTIIASITDKVTIFELFVPVDGKKQISVYHIQSPSEVHTS